MTVYDSSGLRCEKCGDVSALEAVVAGERRHLYASKADPMLTEVILHVYEPETSNVRSVVVLQFREKSKTVKIGKSDTADLTLPTNSLSPLHAVLSWNDGELGLSNNDARCGTFVLMPEKLRLRELVRTSVMMDRYCLTFAAQDKNKAPPAEDDLQTDPAFSTDHRVAIQRVNVVDIRNIDCTPRRVTEATSVVSPRKREQRSRSNNSGRHEERDPHRIVFNFNESDVHRANGYNSPGPLRFFGAQLEPTTSVHSKVTQPSRFRNPSPNAQVRSETYSNNNESTNEVRRTSGNLVGPRAQAPPNRYMDKKMIKSFKDL